MCFSHINVCRVRLLNECNPPCWADILSLLQNIWMVRQIVLEQCSLVIPVVKIPLSNVFLPAVPMSVPPIFERCNCLANIGCWAVCADCSIDAKVSAVQIIVDVVCFIGGFVGYCAFRIHHVDSIVSPRATEWAFATGWLVYTRSDFFSRYCLVAKFSEMDQLCRQIGGLFEGDHCRRFQLSLTFWQF